jgi:hypothetical protein
MDHDNSYETLVNQGLELPKQDFILVMENITKGAQQAMEYLGVSDSSSSWPKFIISNSVSAFGYSAKDDAICFSLRHLNHISQNATPLIYKDQLVCFIPDTFYIIIKYLSWLTLFGRESTVHRYQKLGNPNLHVQFPLEFPENFSTRLLLLSSMEVEARKTVDAIAERNGDRPLWENVNEYFERVFPGYYDKTIDELSKLPKPELSISFEVESFGF